MPRWQVTCVTMGPFRRSSTAPCARASRLRRDDDHATRVDPVDLAVEAAVYALEAQTGCLEHPDQLRQRVEADVVPVQVVAAAIRRDRGEGHVVAARHEVQLAVLEIDRLVRARARFVRHLTSDYPLAVDP